MSACPKLPAAFGTAAYSGEHKGHHVPLVGYICNYLPFISGLFL